MDADRAESRSQQSPLPNAASGAAPPRPAENPRPPGPLEQHSLPREVPWEQLEALYTEIAQAADSCTDTGEFQRELTRVLTAHLPIRGAAVWILNDQNQLELQFLCEQPERSLEAAALSGPRHREFLVREFLSPAAANADAAAGRNGSGTGVRQLALLAEPPSSGGTDVAALAVRLGTPQWLAGVLEVFVPAAERAAFAHVMEGLAELARNFYMTRRLATLESDACSSDEFRSWLVEVARADQTDALPTVLVNETRRYLHCDRASLFLRSGSRSALPPQLQQPEISGVKTVEPRAGAIDELSQLAELLLEHDIREPLSRSRSAEAAPAVRDAFVAMTSGATRRELLTIPLALPGSSPIDANRAGDPAIGVIIAEWFETPADSEPCGSLPRDLRRRLTLLQPALTTWTRQLHIDQRSWWDRVRHSGSLRGLLLPVALLLGLALLFIPADFSVEARGVIAPAELQDVFAPLDGTVRELHVDTDSPVTTDTVLLKLHSPELDQEFERLEGLILARQRSLDSVRAQRLVGAGGSSGSNGRELSADEVQLKAELDGLQAQRSALREQRKLLEVRSPIPGTVLTWNLSRLLQSRPVKSGQVLLTVGDPEGLWTVELNVPDRYAGYILTAQQESDSELNVDFMIGSAVGTRHTAPLRQLALTSEPGPDGQSYVRAEADIARSAVPDVRPGATVTGRIHCGRRPLGFVWFHDLWAFLQTDVLF